MKGEDGALPEPDRVPGCLHPRETPALYGQEAAEATFLGALAAGRLQHAWLLTGPRGVGKATLAWRIARFLLAREHDTEPMAGSPARSLDVKPDTPVAKRISALSEPRLRLLRRGYDMKRSPPRLRAIISVDELRGLRRFFELSMVDGGRRVVIVDSVDELNQNAANAFLKILEEPPAGTVMLLVSHQPARLLPTIRSRCRELRCPPLDTHAMALALRPYGDRSPTELAALNELASGSAGEAARLLNLDGLTLYGRIIELAATLPRLDRPKLLALAQSASERGAELRHELLVRLIETLLARLARSGAGHAPGAEAAMGEAALLARLAPGMSAARKWAALEQRLSVRARQARAVNLDPASIVIDMLLAINEQALHLAA